MTKHKGTLEDLTTIVKGCGFTVEAVANHEQSHQVKTVEGAIINWWPSTGTVTFQGPKAPREKLQGAWGSYTGEQSAPTAIGVAEPVAPTNPAVANKKVFVGSRP